jgi:hypothetical protein
MLFQLLAFCLKFETLSFPLSPPQEKKKRPKKLNAKI